MTPQEVYALTAEEHSAFVAYANAENRREAREARAARRRG